MRGPGCYPGPGSLGGTDVGLRRASIRAALRHCANVLIVAGVLLMADAALTVIWQEPMSAYTRTATGASCRRTWSSSTVAARRRWSAGR